MFGEIGRQDVEKCGDSGFLARGLAEAKLYFH